jgi:hypothetical protein
LLQQALHIWNVCKLVGVAVIEVYWLESKVQGGWHRCFDMIDEMMHVLMLIIRMCYAHI